MPDAQAYVMRSWPPDAHSAQHSGLFGFGAETTSHALIDLRYAFQDATASPGPPNFGLGNEGDSDRQMALDGM